MRYPNSTKKQLSAETNFLQTKFTFQNGQDHRLPYDPNATFSTQVLQSFESSLKHLRTDYIDSYILHGPSGMYGLSDADKEVWSAMEDLQKSGKVKFLGVSNINLEQLELLVKEAEVKPHFVQNRCFAQTFWDKSIRDFCATQNITYQGFSLLTANRHILSNPKLQTIATKLNKTIPQILFRFALGVGMQPLTGTTSARHMQEDLAVFDFALHAQDVACIETLTGN